MGRKPLDPAASTPRYREQVAGLAGAAAPFRADNIARNRDTGNAASPTSHLTFDATSKTECGISQSSSFTADAANMMAHSVRPNALTDELVEVISGFSMEKDTRQFKLLRDCASKGLRNQHYARVNQFDVASRLDGLIEKFRILNNEPLADALQTRLDELRDQGTKSAPEILSFFLHLSDKPVEKTRLADLELLKPPAPPPPLTWAEIIADDPLNEEGVWDEVEFGTGSNSEESVSFDEEQSSDRSTPPSNPAQDARDLPELYDASDAAQEMSQNIMDEITQAQFWRQLGSEIVVITELQAIREVLLMLRGIPSSLFQVDKYDKVRSLRACRIAQTSRSAFHDILDGFARTGTILAQLRGWTKQRYEQVLPQACQASVERRLRHFDGSIAEIDESFVTRTGSTVAVSILELENRVRHLTEPLSSVATTIQPDRHTAGLDFLNRLYERLCYLTMEGSDGPTLSYHYALYQEPFKVYLRPIVRWMQSGELLDDPHSPIRLADQQCDLGRMWSDRFELVPNGLEHPAIPMKKVFTIGKCVRMLEKLGHNNTRPAIDFRPPAEFSKERFEAAINRWVGSCAAPVITLQECLRDSAHGQALWKSLDLLDGPYLSELAIRSIDGGDRYVLAELTRIRTGAPWLIRNIMREHNVHLCIYNALLPLYRAKTTLQRLSASTRSDKLALRQRLLWFADTLLTYMTMDVLKPTLLQARTRLRQATDIDAMATAFAQLVTRLEAQLLLPSTLKPITTAIASLLDLPLALSHVWETNVTVDELGNGYVRLLTFVTHGIQSISRDGEQSWGLLAEKLSWGCM
ncbi:hypothetical protein LTR50_001639 [Elasticomyces elasticus]|nr:hypothetical protein LTR50_001639 [Elasticomyces elasticus]